LDLGNYERFLDTTLTKDNNLTTGKIYQAVIEKERRGEYLGKTVQVVPHVCNEIQEWIEKVAHKSGADACIIELGGTIGDIESMPFTEALRQFQFRVGQDKFCCVLVSLVPEAGPDDEQKTKPTQTSAATLRTFGLYPNVIMCRGKTVLGKDARSKIAQFCHVDSSCVFGVHDVSNLYRVPLLLEKQGYAGFLKRHFHLNEKEDPLLLGTWKTMAWKVDALKSTKEPPIRIALVGKYTNLVDSYKSVFKALNHAAFSLDGCVQVKFIDSETLDVTKDFAGVNGILVPGGFGGRGVEGMIEACHYARTHRLPFLGICLGMQMMVVEICRNVIGGGKDDGCSNNDDMNDWKRAHSQEFITSTKQKSKPVIIYMPEISKTHLGGTMRLGSRVTELCGGNSTLARRLYKSDTVKERHRHRYEVDPLIVDQIESQTPLCFTGKDKETKRRMEIVELHEDNHPFYFGTQFHPEFLSRPLRPSPPFVGFVRAAKRNLLQTDKSGGRQTVHQD